MIICERRFCIYSHNKIFDILCLRLYNITKKIGKNNGRKIFKIQTFK